MFLFRKRFVFVTIRYFHRDETVFAPQLASKTKPNIDHCSKCTCRSTSSFASVSNIPGPKGLPYLGTTYQYRRGPFHKFNIDQYHQVLKARFTEYGGIMKENIGGVLAVRLFDPDYIRVVYQSEGKTPYVTPLLETTKQYREQKNMSPGLGNTNGETWYRLRSAVQQMMMRPKEVTVYLPLIEPVADEFVSKFRGIQDANGKICDFRKYLARWNLESSGMTCFETRLGCLNFKDDWTEKMIECNNEIFVLSTQLAFSAPLYKVFTTPKWKRLVEVEDFFFKSGQDIVDKTIRAIDEKSKGGQLKEDEYNFLTYLLSRPELSYKDVSIITLSLFGDGLNTTVPTFVFFLYCLSKNPEVQQKLFEEITSVVGKERTITAEMLTKLTYMKACLKEVFRFYPIGPEVKRIPQKDLTIGGYVIPAGTNVELCPFVHFDSEKYFVNPGTFLPERWLRDGSANNIHPYLMTPFGHGPRMCAGRRFAEQEIYLLMCKILQKYEIQWNNSVNLEHKFQMLMVPDKSADFTFVERS